MLQITCTYILNQQKYLAGGLPGLQALCGVVGVEGVVPVLQAGVREGGVPQLLAPAVSGDAGVGGQTVHAVVLLDPGWLTVLPRNLQKIEY